MRIALATSSYDPYVGGVEEHVRNVARILRARGHDVVVWTIERDGRFGVREVDGIEVWDLPAPLPARSVPSMLRFAIRMPQAALHWRRAFRSHRPDVIHVHCFGPNGTYARLLAARTGTPLVITSHGETVADDAGVFTHSRFAIDSLRKGLAAAAAVTGCSRVVLEDLTVRFGLAPGRGVVVFNGIDLDEPVGVPPAGVDGRYICAVGRVQKMKGFDLLIEAFARAELPPDIRLIIGGAGPELDALRRQADRLGIGERVVLPGRLDRPTVGALREGAYIGVMPSRFEAFGIAALEVWRGRSALVATTHGGAPEFVTHSSDGLLVDPLDVDALAGALRTLTDEPGLAAQLSAAGAERVRSFTWERAVDAYESVYGDLPAAHAETADTDIT
ncbi:glycosyltransferase family 4 protein [Rathayibacter sp. KR2-224]|uniref:glycosyltransferase family 4 protein n=1 Tax=Rathayibacter sp. KR2-224 TaxID=3400913 RepID=UPI003C0FA193